MKLSVIIVNYKVRYYLQQCLNSLMSSVNKIETEIIVVDNNSNDGSFEMVNENFPTVKYISNPENVGFSKANNIAIRQCKSEYILLLNPDTIVQSDTIQKVLDFMDSESTFGACGVKMIDGKGKFLPESKRGLPTPLVSFYKLSGLSKLFPRSKVFGKYYLSYLDKDESHEIDVLTGAFMCIRKEALDKAGLLDEDYFMYGEDIDLSYKISKEGYKIMYLANTSIIHYKGESTKKSSLNYIYLFYKAMHTFAGKHYSRTGYLGLSISLKLAVILSGLSAAVIQLFKRTSIVLTDILLIFCTLFLAQLFWGKYVTYSSGGSFPDEYIYYFLPGYTLIFCITLLVSGSYDNYYRIKDVLKGVVSGSLFILITYALLPESLRYSRAVVLISGALLSILIPISRSILDLIGVHPRLLKKRRSIVIGSREESERLAAALPPKSNTTIAGFIDPKNSNHGLGHILDLQNIIDDHSVNDVIFSQKSVDMNSMLQIMHLIPPASISYRMAPLSTDAIIGSQTILSFNDLFSSDLNTIKHPKNKRQKRIMDILLSLVLFITFPFQIFIIKHPIQLLTNIITCFLGKFSWVGYLNPVSSDLPSIKQGILNISDFGNFTSEADMRTFSMNFHYAKDYSIIKDLQIIFKAYKHLGRTP